MRVGAYKTRGQVAYIRAPLHVNRTVEFIESHWQRSDDKEKLSRTNGDKLRREENDLCKDAENKKEKERSSHEEKTRGRRKEARNTLGSKMHTVPRWVVQKLGRILSSCRSLVYYYEIAEDRRERCLSHPVFLISVLKLEAGKVDDDERQRLRLQCLMLLSRPHHVRVN